MHHHGNDRAIQSQSRVKGSTQLPFWTLHTRSLKCQVSRSACPSARRPLSTAHQHHPTRAESRNRLKAARRAPLSGEQPPAHARGWRGRALHFAAENHERRKLSIGITFLSATVVHALHFLQWHSAIVIAGALGSALLFTKQKALVPHIKTFKHFSKIIVDQKHNVKIDLYPTISA